MSAAKSSMPGIARACGAITISIFHGVPCRGSGGEILDGAYRYVTTTTFDSFLAHMTALDIRLPMTLS